MSVPSQWSANPSTIGTSITLAVTRPVWTVRSGRKILKPCAPEGAGTRCVSKGIVNLFWCFTIQAVEFIVAWIVGVII